MKKIIILLLIGIVLLTGCENKEEKQEQNKEPQKETQKTNKEIRDGYLTCSIIENLDDGSNVKTTVYADFKNSKITKASSKSVYSSKKALESACDGVRIANQYNEKQISFTCSSNTLTFHNYFDQAEKDDYSRDEFRAVMLNQGFTCEVFES